MDAKKGELINSHPVKLLVVSGVGEAHVVHQKLTLTRMDIDTFSWLSEEFQIAEGNVNCRFCLNGPTEDYNGVIISIMGGNLKRVQSL